jgi:hypothetical protein
VSSYERILHKYFGDLLLSEWMMKSQTSSRIYSIENGWTEDERERLMHRIFVYHYIVLKAPHPIVISESSLYYIVHGNYSPCVCVFQKAINKQKLSLLRWPPKALVVVVVIHYPPVAPLICVYPDVAENFPRIFFL